MRHYNIKIFVMFLLFSVTGAYAGGNWRIEPIIIGKVCYRPGERAAFKTKILYNGKEKININIRIDIHSELDRVESIYDKRIIFVPGESNVINVGWDVPANRKWGHEVRVSLIGQSDKVVAFRSGYFAVGKHPWQVGHWTSCCATGKLDTDREVRNLIIENYRRWHYSAVDYFSWQPSGWETMAPVQNEWISGQTGYLEKKKIIKSLIRQAHENGIQVFSYYQNRSWGPAGVEFIRTHPEWWNFDKFGKPFPKGCSFDVEKLEKMRQGKPLGSLPGCFFTTGLIWRDDMKKFMFEQLKQSVEMFGWDGFRSDTLPSPENVYDRYGKYHKVITEDTKSEKIKWIRDFRLWLKENISPECQMHFNSASVSYGLEKIDYDIFQAQSQGCYSLWEGAFLAAKQGSDLNNMKTFARYLHDEVQAAREVGGYRHVGWMDSLPELLEATATACGAQVDWTNHWDAKPAPATWGPYPWRTFTFRFSRYFWDPNLKHIKNTDMLFEVDADKNIWFDGLAQKRTEDDGTQCIMLHLINLPENYPNNSISVAEKHNIPVKLKLSKLKLNKKSAVDAFVLAPRAQYPGFVKKLSVDNKNGYCKVIIPKLQTWAVVVFRIR